MTIEEITDAPLLLTPGEVAKMLRVDPKTVTRWANSGKLACLKTPGGHTRFRRRDIVSLFEQMEKDGATHD